MSPSLVSLHAPMYATHYSKGFVKVCDNGSVPRDILHYKLGVSKVSTCDSGHGWFLKQLGGLQSPAPPSALTLLCRCLTGNPWIPFYICSMMRYVSDSNSVHRDWPSWLTNPGLSLTHAYSLTMDFITDITSNSQDFEVVAWTLSLCSPKSQLLYHFAFLGQSYLAHIQS